MAEIKLKLKPLQTPDFVYVDMPSGRREDGFTEANKVYLSDLDDAVIESLCEEFVKNIYAKKKKQQEEIATEIKRNTSLGH